MAYDAGYFSLDRNTFADNSHRQISARQKIAGGSFDAEPIKKDEWQSIENFSDLTKLIWRTEFSDSVDAEGSYRRIIWDRVVRIVPVDARNSHPCDVHRRSKLVKSAQVERAHVGLSRRRVFTVFRLIQLI